MHLPPQIDSTLPLPVERTQHALAAAVQHVRVDLRGAHIAVAEQFLHRTDVVAVFQQVRCKAVSQRVAARRFENCARAHRGFYRALHRRFVQMMPPPDAGSGVHARPRCRKQKLPGEFAARIRIFPRECVREIHRRETLGDVTLMDRPHLLPRG